MHLLIGFKRFSIENKKYLGDPKVRGTTRGLSKGRKMPKNLGYGTGSGWGRGKAF